MANRGEKVGHASKNVSAIPGRYFPPYLSPEFLYNIFFSFSTLPCFGIDGKRKHEIGILRQNGHTRHLFCCREFPFIIDVDIE